MFSNSILTCIIVAHWIQTGCSLMVWCVRMINTILNCRNWWEFRRDQILMGIHGNRSIDLRKSLFRSTRLGFWDVRLFLWEVGVLRMCCRMKMIEKHISWTIMTVLIKWSVDHLTGGKFILGKIYKNISCLLYSIKTISDMNTEMATK